LLHAQQNLQLLTVVLVEMAAKLEAVQAEAVAYCAHVATSLIQALWQKPSGNDLLQIAARAEGTTEQLVVLA